MRFHAPRLLALATVLCLAAPVRAQVPTPAEVIGFELGTDHMLASYDQIHEYFQVLGEASDRVVVEEIGPSTEGRPMLLAVISSPENLAQLDRYREISRRLALAADLTDDEARSLAREGRAIAWIDSGLHAGETAHGQHAPELAHWLATEESEEVRRIRDEVITLVMPNMNPDGLETVSGWLDRVRGTDFQDTAAPEMWHPYTHHDNNRDWYLYTQAESRAVGTQIYHRWFPQIVHNQHQGGHFPGRTWVPPNRDPVNPHLDPLVVTGMGMVGQFMMNRFMEEGMPGVFSQVHYAIMWAHGMASSAPTFRNMVGILTETVSGPGYAGFRCTEPDELPETIPANPRAGYLPARTPLAHNPDPWLGGCWRLRDQMDYIFTASTGTVGIASRMREDFLYNSYRMGRRQIERGERGEGGPFAYAVDMEAQRDRGAAAEMLRALRQGGIEVRRADAPFRAGGHQFSGETYVLGPQAFRPAVVDLMEPKDYPGADWLQSPDGPPWAIQDASGYELPPTMGVTVERVEEPFDLPGRTVEEIAVAVPAGAVVGSGAGGYLLSPEPTSGARAVNRLLREGAEVRWALEEVEANGRSWPAGTALVQNADEGLLGELASELGLDFHGVDGSPDGPFETLHPPRIGLYRSHRAVRDEGWGRFVLEQYDFEYETLLDPDIREGNLSEYDIIILPNESPGFLRDGNAPGSRPEEFVGGLGLEGITALRTYVEEGGWLLAIGQVVDFPIEEFGLPVRNVVAELTRDDYFVPGSLLGLDVSSTHPLGFGVAEDAVAWVWGLHRGRDGSVLEVTREDRGVEIFARFAENDILRSGWEIGADAYVAGRGAGVRVPVGSGQVVLLGFDPYFRAQTHATFRLLFNPLYAAAAEGVRADDGSGGSGR